MPLRRSALIALLLAAALCAATRKPVTIEAVTAEVKQQAGLAAVVWAPDGTRFASVENNSVWLYSVPGGERRELTSLMKLEGAAARVPPAEIFAWENRGVAEETMQWSPSGREILIRAGGDLFWVNAEDGKWQQLTSTHAAERDPKLSPDGRRVSFRREHDLYTLEIASRKVTRLTHDGSSTLLNAELDWVYPEELGLPTAHWWSPDSKHIAYLQFDVGREPVFPQVDLLGARGKYEPQRYPKAGDPNADVRVGVVPAQGGPTRWLDFGDPRDVLLARLHWLPDSGSVAVQRLNRIQNRLDLLLADIGSGSVRTLLREQDPYWVNLNDHLRFLKDGRRFLWGSERTGYLHLYLYRLDGSNTQLTRGDWQVEQVAGLDEQGGEIFFISTEQSPLERHLYAARLDGSRRRRLTEAPGTHSISMSPTCGHYLDTHSSLSSPPRRTLHTRDARETAVVRESDRAPLEEYEILPTEIVRMKTSGGAVLYARMVKPVGFMPAKKYPVVVIVYGGPHAQAVRDAWAGLTWEQVLAHRGFLVWRLDNRGTAGRGHAFESAVFRNLGARELEDQQLGIEHLASLGYADTSRMGLYGWSYGGFMTLYTLANAPDLFRAGIAGAPVVEWRNYDTIYTERYMGLPLENPEGYKNSAPLGKAGSIRSPLLLVHNFQDDNVHFQNTMQMADALERAGKQFELMVYPQKTHGVTGPVRRHMLETFTRFFESHLR